MTNNKTESQKYAEFIIQQYPSDIPAQIKHVEQPDVIKRYGTAFLAEVVIDMQLAQADEDE